MSLRIRRGTESQRLATVAEAGEILWTTDQRKLWVGTGASNNPGNASMVNVGKGLAGSGLVWNDTDQVLEVGNFSITTTDVSEGTNLYFRADRAQTVTQAMFTSGDATHTGISFLYNDIDQTVNATVSLSIDDLSDVQIVGTPATNSVLKYNGASWTASTDSIGLTSVEADTTPQLGGDLDLNSNDITGSGNITINGTLSISTPGESISSYNGITDGPNSPFVGINASRGTLVTPLTLQADDAVAGLRIAGYNGSEYKTVVAMNAFITSSANFSSENPQSDLGFYVGNNSSFTEYLFKGNGTFVAPGPVQLAVYANDAARASITPVAGMMILMVSGTTPAATNKVQVYDGSGWVNLH